MQKPKHNADFQPPSSYETMFFGSSNGVGILPAVNSGFRTFHPVFAGEKCIMCSLCWIFCPEGCIDRTEGFMQADMDYCKGCGICAHECPKQCISMVRDGDEQ